MDLTDQIEAYLEAKEYARSTVGPIRSILTEFNAFQMRIPACSMKEKAARYGEFVSERMFLKRSTAERYINTTRNFCRWLDETGRVDAFRLDEHMLGRPEIRRVPEAPVGPGEVVRMIGFAAENGKDGMRDAAMALLAVTCGLTPPEIASLDTWDVDGRGRAQDLFYCGHSFELPQVTSLALRWYMKERDPLNEHGDGPLFLGGGPRGSRVRADFVRDRISRMLDIVGVSYEDAVPGDCQFRIAQHFKSLDAGDRRFVAASVQACAFYGARLPESLRKSIGESVIDRWRAVRSCRDRLFRDAV